MSDEDVDFLNDTSNEATELFISNTEHFCQKYARNTILLKEAIEIIKFYSYKANYVEIMPNARPIQLDGGEKARNFLEKNKCNT